MFTAVSQVWILIEAHVCYVLAYASIGQCVNTVQCNLYYITREEKFMQNTKF